MACANLPIIAPRSGERLLLRLCAPVRLLGLETDHMGWIGLDCDPGARLHDFR